MTRLSYFFLVFNLVISSSCDSGKLEVLADLPMRITESSAAEIMPDSPYLWTIEDHGNKPILYGISEDAELSKVLTVNNAKNHDWEDLTSDNEGNLYIGDFGNNSHDRSEFEIYKLNHPENKETEINAETIRFKMPKGKKPEDFESFFIWKDHFYIFSKNHKKGILLKVANKLGTQTAELIEEFELEGKNKRITSADISDDGKEIVLLAHDKLYLLSDFENDDFFGGTIELIPFDHDSQKEGITFSKENKVVITDEKSSFDGGNIYSFEL